MGDRPVKPDETTEIGETAEAPRSRADDFGLPGFEDVEVVGRGGFGVVYRAYQPDFDRQVAIKVLTGILDDEARARFGRECRAMGRLSGHPAIVTVYASGFDESGRPYLVMDYMADGSLAGRLEREGSLPVEEVLTVGVQLAGALEAAHRSGVLHRDLKPANVLVSAYGEPKLSDFGISRLAGAYETRSGVLSASPLHAAPEVLAGRGASVASDIYSLGSTLYALLAGEPPFPPRPGDDLFMIAHRVATEEPADLAEQGVPAELWSTVARSLAKEPEARPATAAELSEALRKAQASLGLVPTPLPAGDALSATATILITPPASLPSGVVTFLLTDIEDATALWDVDAEAMARAVTRHDELVADAVTYRGGHVLKTRGEAEAAFCVFASAADATAAALALQRALVAEDWPTTEPPRLRVALHTGEAEARGGDYYGTAVNRVARLRGAGHGGQVLLSEATARLVEGDLPEGAGLRDLGVQHLPDLERPERVYQLCHLELPFDFPPLATLDRTRHNLPVQLTSFVGRETELRAVRRLLSEDRLVTLYGPAGAGKTRLALEVAAEAADAFPDGVWVCELGSLAGPDADAVARVVAATIGVAARPGGSLLDAVADHVRYQHVLLVLDGCEGVGDATADLAYRVLTEGPDPRVLATSREPLELSGERLFPLGSMETPPEGLPAEAVAGFDAVRLFCERAARARPDFAFSADNAPAVAEICRRLEGGPAAIEQAAARLRSLSPQALLDHVDDLVPDG